MQTGCFSGPASRLPALFADDSPVGLIQGELVGDANSDCVPAPFLPSPKLTRLHALRSVWSEGGIEGRLPKALILAPKALIPFLNPPDPHPSEVFVL